MAKKRRVKKIVIHKRPSPSQLEARVDDLYKRMTEQEENFKKLAVRFAMQLAQVHAQLGVNIKSIDDLDTNVLVSAMVLKEVFGQLQQIDDMLRILDPEAPMPMPAEGRTLDKRVNEQSIVERATAWYSDVVQDAFVRVRAEKEEHEKQQVAVVQEAKERERIANELKKAEEKNLTTPATAPGSEFPPGAQIFGG